jgi:hypothetical protein
MLVLLGEEKTIPKAREGHGVRAEVFVYKRDSTSR